jgi:hypothetical protein
MKKAILIWVIISLGGYAYAQKENQSAVPAGVKSTFSSLYPNSKVDKWKKENGNYEAYFKKDTKKMTVVIKSNGDWTETRAQIETSELPLPVSTYITTNFPGEKIGDAYKITHAGGGIVTYKADVAKTSLYFDADGTFMKSEKEHGMNIMM